MIIFRILCLLKDMCLAKDIFLTAETQLKEKSLIVVAGGCLQPVEVEGGPGGRHQRLHGWVGQEH